MRKIGIKLALVAVAGLSGAAIVTAPAMATAATTWTVGPNPSETYSASSPTTTLTDNGFTITCASTASGTLASATGNPAQVGTIDNVTFTGCTSILGSASVSNLPPSSTDAQWTINGSDYNASTGVTTGNIGNIKNVAVTAASCQFTVGGKASGTYTNSSGVLAVNSVSGDLTISGVTAGCAGLVSNGDSPTFVGNYTVFTPSGGTTTHPTITGS
ncbi:hypothetical protein BIV57_18455 [Mangrovactinospora gilvigrisea]|uniref:Ig-like domain-containing protein n=1 Tax=Mangrovactinospora gilvigrisea TaxID=1428644 RepID=A0A1J7BBK5_9ACTN|nr:hypothetical protein [Mangrovactinospora gilvigrisea]OIV36035.1 hypothetical protein BIV57_18455 [Mangrovactinospora gilvigrisea]